MVRKQVNVHVNYITMFENFGTLMRRATKASRIHRKKSRAGDVRGKG
jgi:hypothetical protein